MTSAPKNFASELLGLHLGNKARKEYHGKKIKDSYS